MKIEQVNTITITFDENDANAIYKIFAKLSPSVREYWFGLTAIEQEIITDFTEAVTNLEPRDGFYTSSRNPNKTLLVAMEKDQANGGT